MGFLGFFWKRISNSVSSDPLWEQAGEEPPTKKINPKFPMTQLVGRQSERTKENQALRKSWAWKLNLSHWGTGIPRTDKRAHARVVSNLLIISVQKLPVFSVRFKAIASNMF